MESLSQKAKEQLLHKNFDCLLHATEPLQSFLTGDLSSSKDLKSGRLSHNRTIMVGLVIKLVKS